MMMTNGFRWWWQITNNWINDEHVQLASTNKSIRSADLENLKLGQRKYSSEAKILTPTRLANKLRQPKNLAMFFPTFPMAVGSSLTTFWSLISKIFWTNQITLAKMVVFPCSPLYVTQMLKDSSYCWWYKLCRFKRLWSQLNKTTSSTEVFIS